MSATGIDTYWPMFEPRVPGFSHIESPYPYFFNHKFKPGNGAATPGIAAANLLEAEILRIGQDKVGAFIAEPVQGAGGVVVPPAGYWEKIQEVLKKHDILLIADEVICAFGRLGEIFACNRYGYIPDIITCAKGITSGYAPVGAAIISDRIAEPFIDSDEIFLHGMTYGGHPVGCAVALANIDILEREDLPGRVRQYQDTFLEQLRSLEELPIVGDIRGDGYFYGIELVKDKETQGRFSQEECKRLLHDFLSPRLFELGLICRAEDKGEPVVQLAPPLIAGPEEVAEITGILRQALSEAWKFVS